MLSHQWRLKLIGFCTTESDHPVSNKSVCCPLRDTSRNMIRMFGIARKKCKSSSCRDIWTNQRPSSKYIEPYMTV